MTKFLSPCVNICKIDTKTGLCIGCNRKEDEIFNWIYFSDDEKKKILSTLKMRKKSDNKNKFDDSLKFSETNSKMNKRNELSKI
jgi:predicted Fe-S protein YdhL (DUF1289 family)